MLCRQNSYCRMWILQEIQRWKTEAHTSQNELKTAETTIEALRTQLATANERVTALNKTINEQAAKIRECESKSI